MHSQSSLGAPPRKRVELPKNFLRRVDLRRMYPDKRGNPIMVHCPVHGDTGKPNLAVYAQNVYCFHPKCRWHAGVLEYIQLVRKTDMHDTLEYAKSLMGDRPVSVSADVSVRVVPAEPMDRSVAMQYASYMNAAHYAHLKRRYGLSYDTVHDALLGHTKEFPFAYTIPVFSLQRELQNIRFRVDETLMKDTSTKYWGMAGRNQTQLYIPPSLIGQRGDTLVEKVKNMGSYHGWCYLTEGELDALAMMQLTGVPAISTTNGARAFYHPGKELWDIMDGARWMVAYDQDETGREAGKEVASILTARYGRFNVRMVSWNPKEGKDASELLAASGAHGTLEWWDDIFTVKPLDSAVRV